MIEFKSVKKKFNEDVVLNNIDMKLPRYGIVAVVGASGSGKTTLLNAASSLFDFEGDISLDGKSYKQLSDSQKDILRNNKIGFVFQDYKLFEFETVKDNLLLALDIKCRNTKKVKERRIADLLNVIGLENKANELVSHLSGGEKQRVAIARAICNSPSLLLADEPTGNLDEKNSALIMDLLLKISRSSLVLLVSHDETLVDIYADEIIYMSDGKIIKKKYNNHNKHEEHLPLIKVQNNEKKAHLPLKFCFCHAFHNIKQRRWRTLFTLLTTSLGLIGVGLGLVINNIVSDSLYRSYSSIIDSNKVVISAKNGSNQKEIITALEYDEVEEIYKSLGKKASNIGIYYFNDFERMFDISDMRFIYGDKYRTLPNFTLSNFNEYALLKGNETVYGIKSKNLEDDEVILGLNAGTINELCFQLQITRSVESLAAFFRTNYLTLDTNLENSSWGYYNNFQLKIVGFIFTNNNLFYHNSSYWNEYIFEQLCGLSTTDYINTNSLHPWDLIKAYYIDFASSRDSFLKDVKFDKKYRYILAEILSSDYYPILYKDYYIQNCSRVVLLNQENKDRIPLSNLEYFKRVSPHIGKAIIGSPYTYAIYPNNLMMGFAKASYVSSSLDDLLDIIDLTSYIKSSDANTLHTPDKIARGFFAQAASQGMTFNPNYKIIEGSEPRNYEEIVVSRGLVEKLKIVNPINKSIYFCFPETEELLPNGYISRHYLTTDLKIVGISDSSRIELNHEESWSIMFFQCKLGLSSLYLNVDSIALEVDDGYEDEVINSFARSFPNYEAVCPINSIKSSVNEICGYIQSILMAVSISSIVISSLLLSICNYLHFIETKKDIGLARCLGVGRNESKKLIYSHSLLMAGLSFLMSSIELIVICLFLGKTFSETLNIEYAFIFNPLSIVFMLLLALCISLISSLFISWKLNRLNPLECLY